MYSVAGNTWSSHVTNIAISQLIHASQVISPTPFVDLCNVLACVDLHWSLLAVAAIVRLEMYVSG